MTDETELAKSIDAARQAETIVNHPLFIASLATLREVTVERFENLGFSEVQEMQECNLRLNIIEEFEINLVTIIENGEVAFRTLEEIQTFKQDIENERRK